MKPVHSAIADFFSADNQSSIRPWWMRYGVAVASIGAAVVVREALTPAVGPTALPFISFFPAIAVAAWFGGLGPALVSLAVAAVMANWFFIEPIHVFSIPTRFDAVALGGFVVASMFIVGAIEVMHRTKGQLARARDLVATTLASIGDGVIVADAEGRVMFLNAEAERLTRCKAAEARGRPLVELFRIVNEETNQPVENPVDKVLRHGKVVGLANHTVLVRLDGTKIPIDDTAAPIRPADGALFGVVLVFRDVTEQRDAEQARARLAAIVKFSEDAIFTKNLDGVVQTWNASAERLFGYRSDEIIGQPITVLVPAERLHEEPELLARLRSGQAVERFETIRLAKNGRRIPVLISVSPLRDGDGRVIGASKIIHDITDVIAAREALAREKELLATTLASIGDAVIVTDAEGSITFLNSEAERLTGWKRAEAVGGDLPAVFRIVNEQTRQPVENPVEKVLRLGMVVGLANHTLLIAKDGTETPIDDSAAPIRNVGGTLFGVVLVFRDFSARRLAEEQLRQADRRKDEFLAILSHELRNPLAPIRMAVAMLRKIGPPVPELQELRDIIDRQTAQLTRLLDDLLDVSRIASGKIVLRKDRASLGLAVSGAVESVRPQIDSQGHELVVSTPPEPIYIEGDTARLSQVIANLLNNAAKYTERGGRIALTVVREGSNAVVRVRDSGIGISPEQMARIFEMFAQADQTLEGARGGLGVGLALAKMLIELHDGRIEAKSEGLGKGSEFIVRLPCLVAQAAPVSERPVGTADAGQPFRRRILIADDKVDSARVLATALRHTGHEVRIEHDGLATIETATSFVPEVAILDIGMPKMNGYDVARKLRAAFGKHIVLVAITGFGQEEDKRRALEAGFDHHFTKPVDLAAVEQLLGVAAP
jgi:PAS domain S-box-containing protein